MPGKAAQVILDHDIQQPVQMLDEVATALTRAGMHDKAGDLQVKMFFYKCRLRQIMIIP